MAVFADDGADGVNEGKERARFIRRGGEEDLQSCFAHELEGAGGAGSVHFAEGFIEEGEADCVGRARLVEAISLGERCRHRNIKWRCGFAARFLGVDLTQ